MKISESKEARIREMLAAGISSAKIRRELKVGGSAIERIKRQAAAPESAERLSEATVEAGDRRTVTLPKTRICTLEQLVEHCKIDLQVWEVERFECNKWEMGAADKDGSKLLGIRVEPLFQVKAILRRRRQIIAVREEIAALKELAKRNAAKPLPVARVRKPALGNMLELNMPDMHAGKLAWSVETGGPNYDVKIFEQLYRDAVATLLARVPDQLFEEILFVVGNDLLQSDNAENTTYRGTAVSCDGRYEKTYRLVRQLTVETILRLRERAKRVKVLTVRGNHDYMSMFHLGDALECYFHNYKDVVIDNEPRTRKYHQFGEVMLMFLHGDKGKLSEAPGYMAIEEPKMWAATKYRECHAGHKHTKRETKVPQIDEKLGVRTRILSALCPPDDWHAAEGYIGNLQSAEAFLWNASEGLIGSATYNARF